MDVPAKETISDSAAESQQVKDVLLVKANLEDGVLNIESAERT